MSVLLDTNALVWASDTKRIKSLGKHARRLIENSDVVYFSAISIAELQIKSMLGKFKKLPDMAEATSVGGLTMLDFSAEHAQAIANFPSLFRHDPFDRMILGQAHSQRLTLLTSDPVLLELSLDYVVDAQT